MLFFNICHKKQNRCRIHIHAFCNSPKGRGDYQRLLRNGDYTVRICMNSLSSQLVDSSIA